VSHIEWEDPPTPEETRKKRRSNSEFFAVLRRHPGKWAVLDRDMWVTLPGLKQRWPEYEFAVVQLDFHGPERGTVYARYPEVQP
jgi:hypothetical protein